jgi:hypothetical protein
MSIKVLETNVLHASDLIFWLDGTTGTEGAPAQMLRLDRTLSITFDDLPADVAVLHKAGRTALWRRPEGPMVEGMASEAQRARPGAAAYDISGTAEDSSGRYNPRTFELSVGGGSGHSLVMYPTVLGTRLGRAGGLQGSVRRGSDDVPVPWAVLELEVTTSLNHTVTFRAQSDSKGDFLLPMRRLPPLSESDTSYPARLRVRADLAADPTRPLDPAELAEVELGRLDAAGYENPLELSVVPGEVQLLRSHGQLYLAVQPIVPT